MFDCLVTSQKSQLVLFRENVCHMTYIALLVVLKVFIIITEQTSFQSKYVWHDNLPMSIFSFLRLSE